MSPENNLPLNIQITFRHTESTEALKSYATEKVTHCLEKYLQHATEVKIILGVEKQIHSAEVKVVSKNYDLKASAETEDLYSAIDAMIDNLSAQLRKQKEKQLGR